MWVAAEYRPLMTINFFRMGELGDIAFRRFLAMYICIVMSTGSSVSYRSEHTEADRISMIHKYPLYKQRQYTNSITSINLYLCVINSHSQLPIPSCNWKRLKVYLIVNLELIHLQDHMIAYNHSMWSILWNIFMCVDVILEIKGSVTDARTQVKKTRKLSVEHVHSTTLLAECCDDVKNISVITPTNRNSKQTHHRYIHGPFGQLQKG